MASDPLSSEAGWEHFPHDADIGIRGWGPSREAAFAQAGLALTAIVTDPASVHAAERVEIHCTAPDDEVLLMDWLNALIYEMASRNLLFCTFRPTIEGHDLSAEAWGEPVNVARHQPVAEPKGATFTALAVRQEGARWVVQCVVDV